MREEYNHEYWTKKAWEAYEQGRREKLSLPHIYMDRQIERVMIKLGDLSIYTIRWVLKSFGRN